MIEALEERKVLDEVFLSMGARREFRLEKSRFDFLFLEQNIAVELDDQGHKAKIEEDKARDEYFYEKYSIKTIRLPYADIIDNIDECIKKVENATGIKNKINIEFALSKLKAGRQIGKIKKGCFYMPEELITKMKILGIQKKRTISDIAIMAIERFVIENENI